ncbi:hypothetical protein [Peribacillus sp. NPDC097295]|uniref:hypothetical protein n=1 Tax=Peribacillus sp. NPDC097295 TaxID=3364402 RepID=UPI0038212823
MLTVASYQTGFLSLNIHPRYVLWPPIVATPNSEAKYVTECSFNKECWSFIGLFWVFIGQFNTFIGQYPLYISQPPFQEYIPVLYLIRNAPSSFLTVSDWQWFLIQSVKMSAHLYLSPWDE